MNSTTITIEIEGIDRDQNRTFMLVDEAGLGRRIEPGTMLDGKYLIRGILGKGGMGCVFRAEHTVLNKDFAIKVLSPERFDHKNWQRFTAEGKVIARLNHPFIVKVHDMGIEGGDCPFYAMDLLPGITLADFCGSHRQWSITEIVQLFRDVASGLSYAHSKGIIHRDIKPSNIILLTDDSNAVVPKIVDFGIAKIKQTSFEGQSQTKAGEVFGSPLYMSPEQSLGKSCDERSDIYSLGCTLFEVLTGEAPFRGDSILATLMMHQDKPAPRLSDKCPGKRYPDSLELIVAKMLAKNLNSRYQTMQQVIHDLDRVLDGKAIGKSAMEPSGDYLSESTNEGEAAVSASRMPGKFWLACAAAVVLIGLLVARLLMAPKTAPRSAAAKSDIVKKVAAQVGVSVVNDDIDKEFDKENNPIKPDPARIKILKNFKNKISSTLVNEDGKQCRLYIFPSVPIGRVSIVGPQTWKQAAGRVILPLGETDLEISTKVNIDAFYCPDIYSKIDKNEIAALRIKDDLSGLPGQDTPESVQEHTQLLKRIVDIASTWTDLRTFTIQGFSLNGLDAKQFLRGFKNLTCVEFTETKCVPTDLCTLPLWRNVERLRIYQSGDQSNILEEVIKGGHLRKLDLDGDRMTVDLAKKLSRCNRLEQITLKDTHKLSDEVLDIIQHIGCLKALRLPRSRLGPGQIDRFCWRPTGPVLVLDSQVYGEDKLRLSARLQIAELGNCD